MPKALQKAQIKKGQLVFHQKNNVLALRWRNKRDMWMLSGRHTAQMEKTSKQAREGRDETTGYC
jgi:hypothetical protein